MNPQQTAYMIKRLYPAIIVGIKAAHFWGDFTQVLVWYREERGERFVGLSLALSVAAGSQARR